MHDVVANSVKEARCWLGLSQEALAKEVGVTRQTIIAIETGRYVPSLPLALKLSAFFKKTVEELFRLK